MLFVSIFQNCEGVTKAKKNKFLRLKLRYLYSHPESVRPHWPVHIFGHKQFLSKKSNFSFHQYFVPLPLSECTPSRHMGALMLAVGLQSSNWFMIIHWCVSSSSSMFSPQKAKINKNDFLTFCLQKYSSCFAALLTHDLAKHVNKFFNICETMQQN